MVKAVDSFERPHLPRGKGQDGDDDDDDDDDEVFKENG